MTNAELAILGLVAEQPRHGYEIEQVIEERGMRDWTEVGFSSIYYLLKKLEEKGWVQSRLEEASQGPARKVYRATPAGEQALHDAVLEALSAPDRWYSPFLLGLSHLPLISRAETLAAVGRYRDGLVARLSRLQTNWQRQRPLPRFIDAMFEYSARLIGAELDWIEGFIREIEEHDIGGGR